MTSEEVDREIKTTFKTRPGDSLPFITHFRVRRGHLIQLFGKVGYKQGAEIGVGSGKNSAAMCKSIPGLKLICVDPWAKIALSPEGQRVKEITTEHAQARYEKAKGKLAPYDVTLKRMTSMEAVREIESESLDFVYIDGLHDFNSVMLDIINWSTKVRPGGIIAGHDYFTFYSSGVIRAVNSYTAAHSITNWYVTAEAAPTWFWVK